nr:reverse transcriptase domain-containing protein [Tanacetum cinerariifolium]
MQMDNSSLNKVCEKDMYPFLKVEGELGSLMGYQYKCFLRLPKEYSQVRMSENDEEKTGFHTEEGVYCFTHMAKGQKNSAATLQRMMYKALAEQKWQNVEDSSSVINILPETSASSRSNDAQTLTSMTHLLSLTSFPKPRQVHVQMTLRLSRDSSSVINILLETSARSRANDAQTLTMKSSNQHVYFVYNSSCSLAFAVYKLAFRCPTLEMMMNELEYYPRVAAGLSCCRKLLKPD